MKSEVRQLNGISLNLFSNKTVHFYLFLTVSGLSIYLALAQNSKTLGIYDRLFYILGYFMDQMIPIKWTDIVL